MNTDMTTKSVANSDPVKLLPVRPATVASVADACHICGQPVSPECEICGAEKKAGIKDAIGHE